MEKRGSITQVEIFGQTYNVRAEGDSTYIHDLARLVDSRMKEVAERTATVDTTKIAILAALNITDDLYQAEKRRTGTPDSKTGRRPGSLKGEASATPSVSGTRAKRAVALKEETVVPIQNPRRKSRFREVV